MTYSSLSPHQRDWLQQITEKYGIKTVTDVGTGDLASEVPSKSDALLCLWVLNRMTYAGCLAALHNLRASGSKYLIMTDHPAWRRDQPKEIKMQALEAIFLNDKGERIKLIRL